MTGTGQASAAKASRLHPKVTAVLLNQHIGRHLGRPEQTVLAVIDRHRLRNPAAIGVILPDLPARLPLFQREGIRRVAVNLVRGRKNEDCLRTVLTHGFQQVERSIGVDREIHVRVPRRPVVRRLRRRVHHQTHVLAVLLEDRLDRLAVTNVHRHVPVTRNGRFQLPPIPGRRCLLAEENPPQVVVDANDLQITTSEMPHGLRPNQTRRPRDHRYTHGLYIFYN